MTADGSELAGPHAASSQDLADWELVEALFKAVEKGSSVQSPFLHFSWDFVEARHWHMRGIMMRGEQTGWMARVAVSELEQVAKAEQAMVVLVLVMEAVVVLVGEGRPH